MEKLNDTFTEKVNRINERLEKHLDSDRFQRVSDAVCMGYVLLAMAAFLGTFIYFQFIR